MQLKLIAGALLALALGAAAVVWSQERSRQMVDITAMAPDGQPIVFLHILNGDIDAIGALLDAGMDIEIRGFQQATPVISAASSNSWVVVEYLLSRGADPLAIDRTGFNLPWLVSQSSMLVEDAPPAQALARVRALLTAAGHMEETFAPAEAKALLDRNAWPPR